MCLAFLALGIYDYIDHSGRAVARLTMGLMGRDVNLAIIALALNFPSLVCFLLYYFYGIMYAWR